MRGQGSSLSGNEDLQICVTCLSSESVESRTTPIFFAEVEEVTDEVAT